MVGRDVEAYAATYRAEVAEHAHRARTELVEIDPAPRLALDPEFGLLAFGQTPKAARIASDIYHHTIPVLEKAEDHLGGYVPLSPADLFDMEYWDLEQAKLAAGGAPAEMAGTIALVTGAASGIGAACCAELLGRGAAVVGLDVDPAITSAHEGLGWLGIECDVTDAEAQSAAVAAGVERFGGLDHLVVSAGRFGATLPLAELTPDEWRATQAVNVDSVASLLHTTAGLLALSPIGGRVVVIGSKNVPAPGAGAAAYSASKAAVTQLARVAALEWASEGVRVNVVHPDAVFDTGLWTPELLASRADAHGMTIEEYKRRNLLGTEVTSAQVATAVASLCSDAFGATTGASIPIDGGNERVI